jgi:MoaA/NifB/PqqE/SkfB family radical SAM enzyme
MKKYDIIATWQLNWFCNFDCSYCYLSPKDLKKDANLKNMRNIKKAIEFFDKVDKTFIIRITGGEPFLYKKFVNLCQELTKRHYISIVTNLSSNQVYDFAEKINPDKVDFIHASLHIQERERLGLKQDFIKKYKHLRHAGFNIYSASVMHPEVIDKFKDVFAYFGQQGIKVIPKVFRGDYQGKHYPAAYSSKEREIILYFLKKACKSQNSDDLDLFHPVLDEKLINGDISFKGRYCSAGKDFVTINSDGIIKRCGDENYYLGNIFKGSFKPLKKSKKCKARICTCPYPGLKFAEGNPKIITETPKKSFIKDFVYLHTRPVLKPVKNATKSCLDKLYNLNSKKG